MELYIFLCWSSTENGSQKHGFCNQLDSQFDYYLHIIEQENSVKILSCFINVIYIYLRIPVSNTISMSYDVRVV